MDRRTRSRGKSAPKYRLHKASGKAVVTLNGKAVYLGKHGTEESHEKYRRLIAEHWNPTSKPRPTATSLDYQRWKPCIAEARRNTASKRAMLKRAKQIIYRDLRENVSERSIQRAVESVEK